jgi:aminopeptidase N
MKSLLLLAVGCTLLASPQPPALRLPTDVVPSRYHLELSLDPARTDFAGVVTIELKVRKPAAIVWLNQSGLTISAASAEQVGVKQEVKVVPGGDDFVGFEFSQPLSAGEARLRVQFTGNVNLKAGAGIFLSKRNDDRYL